MRFTFRFAGSLVALCVMATGCSGIDSPTALPTSEGGGALYATTTDAVTVDVLQRQRALSRDYSATATIGRSGGRIEIPEAGLRLDVPSGAVLLNTRITVTAPAGGNVAYSFQPHGIVFLRPVEVRQKISVTKALSSRSTSTSSLSGAYYNDSYSLIGTIANALEFRPTTVQLSNDEVRFTVNHFSGYLVSTGRRSGYISSTGNRIPTAAPPLR